jgi:hypothetical protein
VWEPKPSQGVHDGPTSATPPGVPCPHGRHGRGAGRGRSDLRRRRRRSGTGRAGDHDVVDDDRRGRGDAAGHSLDHVPHDGSDRPVDGSVLDDDHRDPDDDTDDDDDTDLRA